MYKRESVPRLQEHKRSDAPTISAKQIPRESRSPVEIAKPCIYDIYNTITLTPLFVFGTLRIQSFVRLLMVQLLSYIHDSW